MQALFSSEKMNWETPQMLFKKLDNIFKRQDFLYNRKIIIGVI